MHCLYCGKEIGPLQILLDDEFCTSAHRKGYSERLGKVLHRLAEPEPAPAPPAGFLAQMPLQEGNPETPARRGEFAHVGHSIQGPGRWPVPVSATPATSFRPLSSANAQTGESYTVFIAAPAPGTEIPAMHAPGLSIPAALLGVAARAAASAFPSGRSRTATAACAESARPGGFRHRLLFPQELRLALCEPEEPAVAEEPRRVESPPPAPAMRLAPEALERGVRPATEREIPAAAGTVAVPRPEMALARLSAAGPIGGARPACRPSVAAPAAAPVEAAGWQIHVPAEIAPAHGRLTVPVPEGYLPVPAAEPVVRAASPSVAEYACSQPATWTQATLHAVEGRRVLPCSVAVAPLDPEPAEAPAERAGCTLHAMACARAVELPRPLFGIAEPAAAVAEPTAPPADSSLIAPLFPPAAASPAESLPAAAVAVAPMAAAHAVRLPQLGLSAIPDAERAARGGEDELPAVVPEAAFTPLEFHSRRAAAVPSRGIEWSEPAIPVAMPPFAMRPLLERLREPAPAKPARKKPSFAEVFSMPRAASPRARGKGFVTAAKAIAAGLLICALLWFGRGTARIGRQMVAANQVTAYADAGETPLGAAEVAEAAPAARRPAPGASKGPVAWVRGLIARRAAAQLTESFENGMAAWGAKAAAYPAGWSHHPEGYVEPGNLALYQPSISFTDYRLEFFGQIENKSMSWAVRARDPQNYYAMKVSVVERGLRPIIAIEHYPVVGGKKGHSVGMPLNVMVHNNTPVLVAVVVRGNHFTASIEGQQVDSWSDEAPASGGVGFFGEAGARARLYWMRVSKNQDLLGRVCAYLSGGRPQEIAGLPRMPGTPRPAPDTTPRPDFADVTLAAARWGRAMPDTRQAIVKHRRMQPWSC